MLSESLGLPRAPLRGPFVNGPYQVPKSQAPRALFSRTNPGRGIFSLAGRPPPPNQHTEAVVVEIHVFGELPEQRKQSRYYLIHVR